MGPVDLLVVGPAGHDTGGIAQYIAEQERELPPRVRMQTFDVATPDGKGVGWAARAVGSAVADAVGFPFRSPPDVLHVHTSHYRSFYLSAFYVLVGSLLWGCPVVLHVHGSSFDEFVTEASTPVAAVQSLVFERTDRIVVLSAYWAETLAPRADEEKLVVLPNAVSPGAYDPTFAVDPPRVTFVSNHIPRKGIVEFVEAVDRLQTRPSTPPFAVDIAGTGPLSHHAAELASRHDAVSYHGYVAEAEKRRLLDTSSVYALPTHAEGLPIAILEAMAGGNAVVSTDVASIPDVVRPENGELVAPGDVDALTAALDRFVSNPARTAEVGRRNRSRIETEYAWSTVVDRLVSLYDSLVAEAPTDRNVGRADSGVGDDRTRRCADGDEPRT